MTLSWASQVIYLQQQAKQPVAATKPGARAPSLICGHPKGVNEKKHDNDYVCCLDFVTMLASRHGELTVLVVVDESTHAVKIAEKELELVVSEIWKEERSPIPANKMLSASFFDIAF